HYSTLGKLKFAYHTIIVVAIGLYGIKISGYKLGYIFFGIGHQQLIVYLCILLIAYGLYIFTAVNIGLQMCTYQMKAKAVLLPFYQNGAFACKPVRSFSSSKKYLLFYRNRYLRYYPYTAACFVKHIFARVARFVGEHLF